MRRFVRYLCAAAIALLPLSAGAQLNPGGVNGENISTGTVTATGSTTARSLADRAAEVINVKDGRGGIAGAKGDGLTVTACVIAASSAALNCPGASFSQADVGKLATIDGAGASGAMLGATISVVTDATHVSLSANASTATGTFYLNSTAVATSQSGSGSYAPGDTITLTGGTASQQGILLVDSTQVASATIAAAGSAGNNGPCVLSGTTGAVGGPFDRRFKINATVAGGVVTALGSLVAGYEGGYTTNPTVLTAEPVSSSCGGLTGAQLNLKMGVRSAHTTNLGTYSVAASSPVSQGSSSGSGTGATFNVTWSQTGTLNYATDDYASINASMASAATIPGSAVVFPPVTGFYGLSHNVGFTNTRNVAIIAQPGTVTLKPLAGNTSGTVLLEIDNSTDILVYGLTLDGGGNYGINLGSLSTAFQDTRVTFDHMAWQHAAGLGLEASTGNTEVTVQNSTARDLGNHWRRTLLAADRGQGLNFCCGAQAGNLNNGLIDSTFEDIGLDAFGYSNQTNFTVGGVNRFNLANNIAGILGPQSAWSAAVWGSANIGGSITGTTATGASGNTIDVGTVSNLLIANNYSVNAGEAAISVAIGTNVSLISNQGYNGNQFGCSSGQIGGISLHAAMAQTIVTGNSMGDTQTVPTQCFGIWGDGTLVLTNSWIDQSNVTIGNISGTIGGTITGYSLLSVTNNQGAMTNFTVNNNNATGRAGLQAVGQSGNGMAIQSNSAGEGGVAAWQSSGTLVSDWPKMIIAAYQSTGTVGIQTGGAAAGNIKTTFDASGNVIHLAGVEVGAPTGGIPAAGTVNAQGLQINGVAVAAGPLSGTTGSIGGGALLAGACTSGTVAVANSTTAMVAIASPVTYPGDGFDWAAYVSAAGTVTVKVCGFIAGTPGATNYNVRIIQ
jgi:hypothetical protein